MKFVDEYRNPELAKKFIEKIKSDAKENLTFMEVCGTHTMAIFRHGIRFVLPENIKLISGPGCPVCVTAQGEIDGFIEILKNENVIATVFGDLMKIPGSFSSLSKEKAEGKDVRIVYSAFDAVEIAKKNKDKNIIFFGIGFETTTPTIAASIKMASDLGLSNFFVFSYHKLVPPALHALMQSENIKLDGFLLPGHVLLVSGTESYKPFVAQYKIPAVVSGFEPVDILSAVSMLIEQCTKKEAKVENAYTRAVTDLGNQKAQKMVEEIFEPCNASWRGIGEIPLSGLKLRKEYQNFDAVKKFGITIKDVAPPKLCICGKILTGFNIPPECKLFKKVCTPENPIGPCMVSSEGTCAAYYKYL